MLRSGSTASVPAGGWKPSNHAASLLQIFPHRCVYIQQRSAREDLRAFPSVMVSVGSKSVKIGLHQSGSTLGHLILMMAIHHVGNLLPPHVCFDLFLSGAATVKDEVACGRAQAAEPRPKAELRTQASAAARRKSELANCRAQMEL